jgi:hypothetical protein
MSFSSTPGWAAKAGVGQGPGLGQAGKPHPRGQPALFGGVDLDLQQPFQRGGQGQAPGAGLVKDAGSASAASLSLR